MTKPFQFDGHWSFNLDLPILYKLVNGSERVNVIIDDHREESPDPYPQQIAAVKFLLANEEEIGNVLKPFLQQAIVKKGGREEDFKYWDLYSIRFVARHKDGVGFMWFGFSAEPGGRDGITLTMHKTRMITDIDDLNGAKERTPEPGEIEPKGVPLPGKDDEPTFYYPHPKYNVLRRWQEERNLGYAMTLIRQKRNDAFKTWFEKKGTEFEEKFKPTPSKALSLCCIYDNEVIAQYILKKYKPFPNADVKHCISNLNKSLAIVMIRNGSLLHGDISSDMPTARLFARMRDMELHKADDAEWKRAFEMLEWIYSLGERPVEKEWNHFLVLRELSDPSLERIQVFMETLARKYTQIHTNARDSVDERFRTATAIAFRRQQLEDAATQKNASSTLYSLALRKLQIGYLIAEGVEMSPNLFPVVFPEQLQTFLVQSFQKYNPLMLRVVNYKAPVNHQEPSAQKVAHDVWRAEERRENARSIGRTILHLLRLFR